MISATLVRYIKLGREGMWEKECEERGIIRFGFDSAKKERFEVCQAGRWSELVASFIAEDKSKGTATNFTNQTRLFFEDDGRTLWLTFIGERMCWGFLEPTAAKRHEDGEGVWRSIADGWRDTDLNGDLLTKDRLSGALTQIVGYQGTSCAVKEAEYAIRRISGRKSAEVETALTALNDLHSSVPALLKGLGPYDFELLVELVFSTSGWRRLGSVGKTQKTLDIDMILPSTGERAFVQVKSRTNDLEFAGYVAKFDDLGPYNRMFYVFHTCDSHDLSTDDDRVTVIGPEKLAELVVDAGLVRWLIQKVS